MPWPPIDLAVLDKRIFLCCKDGVYELEQDDQMEIDDEDEEDLFFDPAAVAPKKQKVEEKDSKEAPLRVKFKREALCFASKGKMLFSLHKKSYNEAYIEATDLQTFHCLNSNVHLLKFASLKEQFWMLLTDQDQLIVSADKEAYMGEISGHLMVSEMTPLSEIRCKFDLYSRNVVQRPKLSKSDPLWERILDDLKVDPPRKGKRSFCTADICDINFFSHDLVLIVVDKGQLMQYQRNAKTVCRSEIPISHVSLTKQRLEDQGCLVMTSYGAIYKLNLPYNDSDYLDEVL